MFSIYSLYMRIKGNKKYSEGKTEEFFKYYKKAASAKFAPEKTKMVYGYFLLKYGNIKQAEKVLKEINAQKMKDSEKILLDCNLCLILWKKGELDKAIEKLEEMHKEANNTTIYENLGYFYLLKGDYDKALEFNKEAYEYNNSDLVIMDNIGQSYYYKEEYEQGKEIYEKLINSNPHFPEAYYNYGLILVKLGNNEEALKMMKKALECEFTFLSTVTKEGIENEILKVQM